MSKPHTYIFLAGLENSLEGHWQRHWHQRLGGIWVEHADWSHPARDIWVAEMDAALKGLQGEAVVVAHSLGCQLFLEWTQGRKRSPVIGAFLVAFPDAEDKRWPPVIKGFKPVRDLEPPCPVMLVASRDDPFAGMAFYTLLASTWNQPLVDVGKQGHINAESGLGEWMEGQNLLRIFTGNLG